MFHVNSSLCLHDYIYEQRAQTPQVQDTLEPTVPTPRDTMKPTIIRVETYFPSGKELESVPEKPVDFPDRGKTPPTPSPSIRTVNESTPTPSFGGTPTVGTDRTMSPVVSRPGLRKLRNMK